MRKQTIFFILLTTCTLSSHQSAFAAGMKKETKPLEKKKTPEKIRKDSNFELQGILVSNATKIAVIKDIDHKKTLVIKVGDKIHSETAMTLKSIDKKSVILSEGNHETVLYYKGSHQEEEVDIVEPEQDGDDLLWADDSLNDNDTDDLEYENDQLDLIEDLDIHPEVKKKEKNLFSFEKINHFNTNLKLNFNVKGFQWNEVQGYVEDEDKDSEDNND